MAYFLGYFVGSEFREGGLRRTSACSSGYGPQTKRAAVVRLKVDPRAVLLRGAALELEAETNAVK
jgi:hypothetical protein